MNSSKYLNVIWYFFVFAPEIDRNHDFLKIFENIKEVSRNQDQIF